MLSGCHCESYSYGCAAKEAEVINLPKRTQASPWLLWSETVRCLCFGAMLQTHQSGVLKAVLSPNSNSAIISADSPELVT